MALRGGLVILGIVFHCAFLLSIFDIYFRSPLVHGMQPEKVALAPPAKRLVLFVADGLRADKFLETNEQGESRAPFLHRIVKTSGAWGVSHARVPTESRPGHVALIAGFYEDVSAVTKGWKTNPVEFDSVFNESVRTWSWGSPDILPMFGQHVPHVYMSCYDAEGEDFASDATGLDNWVFQRVEELFANAQHNKSLRQMLHQDQTIFFLHLLGIDTNGHAYRPFSQEYLHNIGLVDAGVARIHNLFARFFNDSATAFIFTSDHGMSNKGSHGDGELANTQTPFVAWGAGIRKAVPATVPLSLEQNPFTPAHLVQTPLAFADLKRTDINQADVAPLMSCLLGLAYPMNSVGILPVSFLNMSSEYQAHSLYKNALQILHQFERKSELKRETAILFRPFAPLLHASRNTSDIERALLTEDYHQALDLSITLIATSLRGLYYFQTYEWTFLMGIITLGYVGWIGLLLCIIVQRHSSLSGSISIPPVDKTYALLLLGACALAAVFLRIESSPILYYVYAFFPILFWAEIYRRRAAVRSLLAAASASASWLSVGQIAFFFVALEFMVAGYYWRELFSVILVLVGVWNYAVSKGESFYRIGWLLSCCCLALFPCLSAELETNILIVCLGGLLVTLLGTISFWYDKKRRDGNVLIQLFGVVVASWLVYDTNESLDQKKGLPPVNQLMSWVLLAGSMLPSLFFHKTPTAILRSLFLSLAAPFILMSISYEVLFYCCLGLCLQMWLFTETEGTRKNAKAQKMTMQDAQAALFFLLFCYVAFFGTGNIASISSFELASTLRFMTVFRPFAMGALLLWKIFIPFILVACTFRAISSITGAPEEASFLSVVAFSDVMTLHFFFLVQDNGSWKDIGTSISHFAISNLFIIFALVLLSLSHLIMGEKKEKQKRV